MLKTAFKTELIQADSPLLSHSSSTLIRRGNRSQFVKTQLALWADWNHFSTQQNATDKTDLLKGDNKLWTAQWFISCGGQRLSVQEWKYPPDVINRCIINPIHCLGATDWLHASVTLSNPRVSITKKKKTLKYLSGHGVRCMPWNIHNPRAEPQ